MVPVQSTNRGAAKMAFASPMTVAATVARWAFGRAQSACQPALGMSIESVYRAVAKGLFPAGGGEMRTFKSLDPEIRDQLKIIWQGEPLPPLAFAAHPRVGSEKTGQVAQCAAQQCTPIRKERACCGRPTRARSFPLPTATLHRRAVSIYRSWNSQSERHVL